MTSFLMARSPDSPVPVSSESIRQVPLSIRTSILIWKKLQTQEKSKCGGAWGNANWEDSIDMHTHRHKCTHTHMHKHMCMYTCTHEHINMCVSTDACAHVQMSMPTDMHAHAHIHVHKYVCTHACMQTQTHEHISMLVCVYRRVCIYACVNMSADICAHMHSTIPSGSYFVTLLDLSRGSC